MSEVDLWTCERAHWEQGPVCGIDEAGRGPLAGPVYAAAVILPRDLDLAQALPGLNDSKKLTDKKRRELFEKIKACALAYGIASASPEEIDEINILRATFLAMSRAVEAMGMTPACCLVDGNRDPELGLPAETIIKGDSLSASIAAASILAKVSRDDVMLAMGEQYPQYGFEVHKGYGTKRHYAALEEFGSCPIHRQSFLKKFYAGK
ncbi:MAG: ribonuclease HII [Candidatus Faecousia sp.]|nr:ribonuclease HII [Bacillota bacterium]MDY4219433.1 ribonuclease HII [Candidatus Faecousia sp.]